MFDQHYFMAFTRLTACMRNLHVKRTQLKGEEAGGGGNAAVTCGAHSEAAL
jgi:hypothetical protein